MKSILKNLESRIGLVVKESSDLREGDYLTHTGWRLEDGCYRVHSISNDQIRLSYIQYHNGSSSDLTFDIDCRFDGFIVVDKPEYVNEINP